MFLAFSCCRGGSGPGGPRQTAPERPEHRFRRAVSPDQLIVSSLGCQYAALPSRGDCRADASKESRHLGDMVPFGWLAVATPGVSYSRPIFTAIRDYDFRDGNLGLAGRGLRLETAGGGSAPGKEGFPGLVHDSVKHKPHPWQSRERCGIEIAIGWQPACRKP